MFKKISIELKEHAPFTLFGAITGIVIMIMFQKLPSLLFLHLPIFGVT